MMTTRDPETASTQSVMDGLQRELANAFVLHANYKRYHWQTFGPSFRDLHLLFDELGAAVARVGTLTRIGARPLLTRLEAVPQVATDPAPVASAADAIAR